MIIEKDKTFRVGDLVRVSHPNGAGSGDGYVIPGTLGIITRLFGDRRRRGTELEIVPVGVGQADWYYAEGWEIVSNG